MAHWNGIEAGHEHTGRPFTLGRFPEALYELDLAFGTRAACPRLPLSLCAIRVTAP